MTEPDFGKVARRSGRAVMWIQLGEAILLALAAVAIVILVVTVYDNRAQISRQQSVIAAQQARLARQQQELATQAAAQRAETVRVREALCDSQFAIATAPIEPPSSKLGVSLVESFRKGFVVLGCMGSIGLPPKELQSLGHHFGVPIRY
jgi:hypothetical protein